MTFSSPHRTDQRLHWLWLSFHSLHSAQYKMLSHISPPLPCSTLHHLSKSIERGLFYFTTSLHTRMWYDGQYILIRKSYSRVILISSKLLHVFAKLEHHVVEGQLWYKHWQWIIEFLQIKNELFTYKIIEKNIVCVFNLLLRDLPIA